MLIDDDLEEEELDPLVLPVIAAQVVALAAVVAVLMLGR